jgi:hypothetical protein
MQTPTIVEEVGKMCEERRLSFNPISFFSRDGKRREAAIDLQDYRPLPGYWSVSRRDG